MEDKKKSNAQKVYELHKKLNGLGVPDVEILDYFLGRMLSIESLEILRDFSDMIDVDWEGGEDE